MVGLFSELLDRRKEKIEKNERKRRDEEELRYTKKNYKLQKLFVGVAIASLALALFGDVITFENSDPNGVRSMKMNVEGVLERLAGELKLEMKIMSSVVVSTYPSAAYFVDKNVQELGVPPAFESPPGGGLGHCVEWDEWLSEQDAVPLSEAIDLQVRAPSDLQVGLTDIKIRAVGYDPRKPIAAIRCDYGGGGETTWEANVDFARLVKALLTRRESPEGVIEERSFPKTTLPIDKGKVESVYIETEGRPGYHYWVATVTILIDEKVRVLKFGSVKNPLVTYIGSGGSDIEEDPILFDWDLGSCSWVATTVESRPSGGDWNC